MSTPTHLRPVDDHQPAAISGGLPDFEGQTVHATRVKLSSVGKLEAGDQVSRIDDTVRMYVEGKVVRVEHVVDEPSGELMRIHTIKVIDAVQLPWDFDTGQFEE